ncbi:hypothetical protein SCALM49S_00523 [Streptomyces californicus]
MELVQAHGGTLLGRGRERRGPGPVRRGFSEPGGNQGAGVLGNLPECIAADRVRTERLRPALQRTFMRPLPGDLAPDGGAPEDTSPADASPRPTTETP